MELHDFLLTTEPKYDIYDYYLLTIIKISIDWFWFNVLQTNGVSQYYYT